ncbi:hypothetical protein [Dongshaea marina]|uniref:hypothetical protein n=1 Tax=Dongshaea marina TaxID=2047966 RepID=UPI000D3E92A3|nr:hypothetical protein [Dongshaea marina]
MDQKTQGDRQQDSGCAILVHPGTYSTQGTVGYFTQVAGLGKNPDAVHITGGDGITPAPGTAAPNDTRTFWRALENMHIDSEVWSVSQGAALRRMHLGSLKLSKNGYSSGGFIADTRIDGGVNYGSQQQWFTRNSEAQTWQAGGNPFNKVFLGSTQQGNKIAAPNPRTTVVDVSPQVAEKPFIIEENNQYRVFVPSAESNKTGPTTDWSNQPGSSYPILRSDETCSSGACFHLVTPDNSAADINQLLSSSSTKGIIFAPGNYRFEAPIVVSQTNTVLLGLGYPKLHSSAQNKPVIETQASGVTLSGLMFGNNQGSESDLNSRTAPYLQMDKASGDNLSYLHDIFVRIGINEQKASDLNQAAIVIKQNNVIGDNLWLWARDGGGQVGSAYHGLYITGDNVKMYGLSVEHFYGSQVTWSGDKGAVYFYQSELPYSPPATGGDKREPSFKIESSVKKFDGYGIGAYAVVGNSWSDATLYAPNHSGIHLTNTFFWNLANPGNINHVIQTTNDGVTPVFIDWDYGKNGNYNQAYKTYWQGEQ